MLHEFRHVAVRSLIGLTGANKRKVEDIGREVGISDRQIRRSIRVMGFRELRSLPKSLTMTELFVRSAKKILASQNKSVDDVDGLIVVMQLPDYQIPATGYVVQSKLELPSDTIIYDLISGCSGYVNGLFLGSSLIESGICKNVLLCAGEFCLTGGAPEPTAVSDQPSVTLKDARSERQTGNSLIFGDGASVTLLSRSSQEIRSVFAIRNHGELYESDIDYDVGYARYRIPEKTKKNLRGTHIDGATVADFAMSKVKDDLNGILAHAKLETKDVAYLIAQQANVTLLNGMASMMGMGNSWAPFLAAETGNTASASIPLGISENISSLADLKKKPALLCGFGVGLSAASALVDMRETEILPVLYL